MINSLFMQFSRENKTNIQQVITKCIPAFEKVLSGKDWDKVIQCYLRRVDSIPKEYNGLITSSCLMDLIICSLGEDQIAKANQETINAINDEICKALTYCNYHPRFMGKVKDLIRKTIMEMDNDIWVPNSAFKNWINELFVFNLLAKKKECEIVDIERPILNGKKCDFVCKIGNDEEVYFEVVTIQRIDPSLQDDSTTMNAFIKERVKAKYQEKTKDLLPKDIPNIRILPIIEYVDGLERFNISLNSDIATEPFAIMKNNLDGIVYIELQPLHVYLSKISTQLKR